MRPVYSTKTGTGTSPWIPLDITQSLFNVGIGITISATATYTLEYTYDNIFDSTVTTVPFTNAAIGTATGNKDTALTTPCTAVRLNVTANTGSVKLAVIQGLDG